VSRPGDALEREADRVADSAAASTPLPHASEAIGAAMGARLGVDLDGARLHTDATAARSTRALAAKAFTVGRDVYFGAGQYRPDTAAGRHLLAHEFVHVAQQNGAPGFAPSGPMVQRQDEGETPPPVSSPEYRLHLDPELERLMLQHYLRWSLGAWLTTGDEPANADEAAAAVDAEEAPSPDAEEEPAAESAAATADTPGPLFPRVMPLGPDFFQPLGPDVFDVVPDYGAILSPFNQRFSPRSPGDVVAAESIYRRNYALVQLMPDLRALAPDLFRPLIPTDWRRSIAGGLTAAFINAQLRSDFPTAIEISDRSWEAMTGAGTVYIPIPGFSW
jgi:hypothetical protein